MNQINTKNGSTPRLDEVPFENVKGRSRWLFLLALSIEAAHRGSASNGASPSYEALLPFVRAVPAERESLREFVLSLPPPAQDDLLAQQARAQAEQNQYHWSQLLLQLRVAGLRRIDDWDIRCIHQLREIFPACVPRRLQNVPLYCRIAEPSGEWVVGPCRT